MDSLKAFGRAFGKLSSLFVASSPLVLRQPVELAAKAAVTRTSHDFALRPISDIGHAVTTHRTARSSWVQNGQFTRALADQIS